MFLKYLKKNNGLKKRNTLKIGHHFNSKTYANLHVIVGPTGLQKNTEVNSPISNQGCAKITLNTKTLIKNSK